jgi:hypothetical protein
MKLTKKIISKIVDLYNCYKGNKGNFRWFFKKKYPKIFNYIMHQSFSKNFNEKIYCLLNDIKEPPVCKYCKKNPVSFKNLNEGYRTYCSDICSNKDLNNRVHKNVKKQSIKSEKVDKKNNSPIVKITKEWSKIKDKKEYLINSLPNKNNIKITREFGITATTIYKLINDFKLHDLVIKKDNIKNELNEIISKHFKTIVNDNSIINEKLDIVIPEKKVAIKINEIYWDTDLNNRFKKYHANITKMCEKKGYQLLQIFDYEFYNKKEVVVSIIKAKLGLFDKRLYARKCEVRELDNYTKNTFLDMYHLQGKDNSKIKLGLYYNNELVSVMTFGKSRYNKKYEWEMFRFANKSNYQIIGGASKLINHFIKNSNPQSIITYADARYSNGNLYKKLGFELDGISEPNYFYIDGEGLASRVQFQKHKLKDKLNYFNSDLTEWDNMQFNGYDRIWDCGNYRFVWKRDGE